MASFDETKIRENIETKEKALIQQIADKVSDELLDSIQDNFENKMQIFIESVDTAYMKVSSIGESLAKLNSAIENLSRIDFSDEMKDLQSTQQAVTNCLSNAQSVLEDFGNRNNEYLLRQSDMCLKLQKLQNDLMQAVEKSKQAEVQLVSDVAMMDEKAKSFHELMVPANEAVLEFKQQAVALKEDSIAEQMHVLEVAVQKNGAELEKLHNESEIQRKASKLSIGILAVGIVMIILQVISFFA